MSILSHNNVELSFFRYIKTELEDTFSYEVNYGNELYGANTREFWLSLKFEELNAGLKVPSIARIDTFSRIKESTQYFSDESTALDRIRTALTNPFIRFYDFSSGSAVEVEDQKLLIKNSSGRLTINKVSLDLPVNPQVMVNVRRSSVLFNLMLITDTAGGRTIP